jgi:hypothetical protein
VPVFWVYDIPDPLHGGAYPSVTVYDYRHGEDRVCLQLNDTRVLFTFFPYDIHDPQIQKYLTSIGSNGVYYTRRSSNVGILAGEWQHRCIRLGDCEIRTKERAREAFDDFLSRHHKLPEKGPDTKPLGVKGVYRVIVAAGQARPVGGTGWASAPLFFDLWREHRASLSRQVEERPGFRMPANFRSRKQKRSALAKRVL